MTPSSRTQTGSARGPRPALKMNGSERRLGAAPNGLGVSGRATWKRLAALDWVAVSDPDVALRARQLAHEQDVLQGLLRDGPRDWRTRQHSERR